MAWPFCSCDVSWSSGLGCGVLLQPVSASTVAAATMICFLFTLSILSSLQAQAMTRPGSVCGGDGRDDAVHRLCIVRGSWRVSIDHDGEDDSLSAGAVEISTESTGFAKGSCLGEEVVFERSAGEAATQTTVFTTDRERVLPLHKPGLCSGVGEEFGGGTWSCEVVAAETRAVVED